jgi:hypothetical protein
MNYYIILAALFIALMLSFIFTVISPSRTPWRGIFLFFLIIFLSGWAGQLWITPFGPLIGGVSFLPLLIVGVIFSLLIAIPPPISSSKNANGSDEAPVFALGIFFWFLIIILLTSIIIGYYKMPMIVHGVK